MPTNIQQLASALDVLRRMEKAPALRHVDVEHWDRVAYEWRTLAEAIIRDAPSGSGIDCGTKLCESECTATRVVLTCAFHHMDGDGYYNGWTEHTVVLTPAFDGIAVKVGGRDRNGIKEYLSEVYYDWARSECSHKFTMPAPIAA